MISRHPRPHLSSSALWELRRSNLSTPRCCFPTFPVVPPVLPCGTTSCRRFFARPLDLVSSSYHFLFRLSSVVGMSSKDVLGSVLVCIVDDNDGTYMRSLVGGGGEPGSATSLYMAQYQGYSWYNYHRLCL